MLSTVETIDRRTVLSSVLGAGVLAISGCSLSRGASYRFRMTVEAQTIAGPKLGSSVMQVIASRFMHPTSESGAGRGNLLGEAVALDLPDRAIFVLLKLPDSRGELGGYVTQALAGGKRFAGFADYFVAVQKLGGWFGNAKAELPRAYWPMMGNLPTPTTQEPFSWSTPTQSA
jgi:hypothetical protein